MPNKIPADRIQLAQLAPRGYAAMFRLSSTIQLDQEIRELIAATSPPRMRPM